MISSTGPGTFVVTLDWVMAHTESGLSLTRDQVLAVGDTWPIQQGWKQRWVGKMITEEQRLRFEERLKFGPAKRRPVANQELF
jgi:hypothetical protein